MNRGTKILIFCFIIIPIVLASTVGLTFVFLGIYSVKSSGTF